MANTEIEKVINHISENESMFGYMDLKLRKVSYYSCEQVNNDFIKELSKRPELSSVFSFYSASFVAKL